MKKLVITISTVILFSCTSQRISQFTTFATAGESYSGAMVNLTQEAGKIAIDADSEHLLQFRDKYTEEDRKRIILERDSALKGLLETIGDIRAHTSLLSRYFTALGQLAGSESPVTITARLTSLVSSLGTIHPKLVNASIGNVSVKDFIGSAAPFVISGIKQKKLEDELRRNAGTIERELELQNAILRALSEEMQNDLEMLLKLKDFNQVLQPYINTGQPGKEWKNNRKEVMTAYLSLDAVENAQAAAGEMKTAFLNLLENKISVSGFKTLFDNINAMIDLVEKVRGNSEN